jgi:hypothetical protein
MKAAHAAIGWVRVQEIRVSRPLLVRLGKSNWIEHHVLLDDNIDDGAKAVRKIYAKIRK